MSKLYVALLLLLRLSEGLLDSNAHDDQMDPVKTVPQLIESFGYPVEEHVVKTEDGYHLTLHRIPHGRKEVEEATSSRLPLGPAVFLGHCLVGSSAIWTFGPRDNSLAYMLADAGYDVWMINIRGNSYSKQHEHLDSCPNCGEFWSFGFHESAIYDYPATVDKILQVTGQKAVYFVGYSMGTTQYLVFLSERPEYNAKVKAGFLLGPTAFGGNANNGLIKLADQAELIQSVFQLIGMEEFMPNFLEIKSRLAHKICGKSYVHSLLCQNIYAAIVGIDPTGVDPASVPTFMSQLPAGASLPSFVHYAQLFRNGGKFTKYDYGAIKNFMVYGSASPPEYDLSLVTAPTVLYGGLSDGFATPKDTDILAEKLPNLIANKVVSEPLWAHLDFIVSKNAGKLVYSDIVDSINKLEGREGNCKSSSNSDTEQQFCHLP